ncbi:(deoxy)nucleoside triphosphate pyrophosphohydrolase [Allobranchiibius sp. GilTou73]|uniref:(deoxy)nucleoside triphosphate pyrophosphohydrolase n=1 Tax=Allobranchiibius sp. GilTou73 TaxID=2904523 RepID=UPI001F47B61F|nr:(deoxy)nucleoside triphosphate pyrophosphohydrolase [Allobranchiibius sp. GilTou73]UIJ36241.1 (deoxy)nucleoside triphosphate pyrophosphohydrolase [Allobranchiibius sp. GilTou73]
MTDAAAQPITRVVVGAAIVDDLAHPTVLLAARRTAPSALAGGWEFPGGKVEQDESLEAALHRELAEELDVTVELGEQVTGPVALDEATGWPLKPGFVMQVRFARITTGTMRLVDHDQVRWLTPAQLYDVPWLPADLPIVDAIRALLH